MRAKRSKQYRKLMHQYALSFDFREPYQVLVDAQTIQDAAKFKMRLGSLLQGTLHGTIKPMITQCCIRHLYSTPATTSLEKQEKEAWIEVAKAAERRRCGHHELQEPLSTLDCMTSVVDPKGSGTNKHRYVVASQDAEVRQKMRGIAGVPIVYIHRSVMILEPMAGATLDVREREENGKLRAGLKGGRGAMGVGLKRKREGDDEMGASQDGVESTRKKLKAKGPKAPNPLSVMKAKREKKSEAREVEDERAVLRKTAKRDPQAVEKAIDASLAVQSELMEGITEGSRKRKRKRKQPKEKVYDDALMGTGVKQDWAQRFFARTPDD